MKQHILIVLTALLIALVGCTQTQPAQDNSDLVRFESSAYGFSFLHPAWEERTQDLPNQWAISGEGDDTILFIVADPTHEDLLELGKLRAVQDLFPIAHADEISQEQLDEAQRMVRQDQFGSTEWYTYAIKFSQPSVDTIVSGTLCSGKEVTIVLVTSADKFDVLKEDYRALLASFTC